MNPTATLPPEITSYIQSELGRGIPGPTIETQLISAGWAAPAVTAAMGQVAPQQPVQSVQPAVIQGAPAGAAPTGAVIVNAEPAQPGMAMGTVAAPAMGQPAGVSARPALPSLSIIVAGIANDPRIEKWLTLAFQYGFASIFIINGIIAWIHPQDFRDLLATFPLPLSSSMIKLMVMFTGFHDLVLGGLVAWGRGKLFILAWAGLWLALVTFIKLFTLF